MVLTIFFFTLDLASGYWQVEMDDDARAKSAFVITSGLYECNILPPFGLCNAPSTFEGLYGLCFGRTHFWCI